MEANLFLKFQHKGKVSHHDSTYGLLSIVKLQITKICAWWSPPSFVLQTPNCYLSNLETDPFFQVFWQALRASGLHRTLIKLKLIEAKIPESENQIFRYYVPIGLKKCKNQNLSDFNACYILGFWCLLNAWPKSLRQAWFQMLFKKPKKFGHAWSEIVLWLRTHWPKILLVEIGKIIGRRRLTKKIHQILHAFCTPTHSPKKLTPFYHYILVFGGVPKYFDECVSTNLLQL